MFRHLSKVTHLNIIRYQAFFPLNFSVLWDLLTVIFMSIKSQMLSQPQTSPFFGQFLHSSPWFLITFGSLKYFWCFSRFDRLLQPKRGNNYPFCAITIWLCCYIHSLLVLQWGCHEDSTLQQYLDLSDKRDVRPKANFSAASWRLALAPQLTLFPLDTSRGACKAGIQNGGGGKTVVSRSYRQTRNNPGRRRRLTSATEHWTSRRQVQLLPRG